MNREELRHVYQRRRQEALVPLATELERYVKEVLSECPRIDRVVARAKGVDRFLDKAEKLDNGVAKYSDPLNQIQDQVGVRVVAFYLADIDPTSKAVLDYLAPIEDRRIVPDSPSEFGYEGRHFILFIPNDLLTADLPREHCPTFFELQVKTLFQHAWAEADHDLAYKAPSALSFEQRRKIAFTAAQAWGADMIFNELARDLPGVN